MNTESTTNRYIEIDSTYRNRILYPLSSSFEVNITGNNRQGNLAVAKDPIITGAPLYTFKGNVVTHSDFFGGGVSHAPKLGATASSIDGYYNGCILTNDTTGETSLITKYDGFLKIATLNHPFGALFAPVNAYSITDISDAGNVYWNMGSEYPNENCEKYLVDKTIAERRLIVAYCPTKKLITLETPFSAAWNVPHQYEISSIPEVSHGLTTALPTGPTTVQLSAAEPIIDNVYKGYYIRFINGPLNDEYRLITKYTGATKTAQFAPPVTASLFNPQQYQILRLDRDNVVDFNMWNLRGTLRMKILDLTVPNLPLQCGGSILDYPFVYVVITDKNNETNYAITSNNPYTARVTFKCPIDDVSCPIKSRFIKLKSSMSQLLRLNTTLVFNLLLPNGQPVAFAKDDFYSPKPPNPQVQISCTLKVKKHVAKNDA